MGVDPLFIAVAVAAVFIVALAKSGLLGSLGLAGVPILTLVMPAKEAAAFMLPILLVMDVIAVWAWRHEISWPNIAILIPGAIIGTGLGWLFWASTPDAAVTLFVGLISVIFVLDAWFPIRKRLAVSQLSKPWGVFWGSVAGFTSFVSHSGGPPFQVYVLPQRLSPAIFGGTTAVFFAAVNALKIVPYATLGQLDFSVLELSAWFFPVAVAGMLIGVWAVRRISPDLFYQVTYVLVFGLGLKLIWDGAAGLWFA